MTKGLLDMSVADTLRRLPLGQKIAAFLAERRFRGSGTYWEQRYASGGNSGAGSYNRLAHYKADFLNRFVAEHKIGSVVEFGCGDGAQLTLAQYPKYVGIDVSPTIIERCKDRFRGDASKKFYIADAAPDNQYDLAVSLDVIFHLVEDAVFDLYMKNLFSASNKYIIVYSSNKNAPSDAPHVKHRCFSDWIAANTQARLVRTEENAYPFDAADPDNTSFADFYVYELE